MEMQRRRFSAKNEEREVGTDCNLQNVEVVKP